MDVRGRHLRGELTSLLIASLIIAYIFLVLGPVINLQLVKQPAAWVVKAETILVESADKCIYSVNRLYFYSSLTHIGFPRRALRPVMYETMDDGSMPAAPNLLASIQIHASTIAAISLCG